MPGLRNARVRGLAIAALASAVLAGACGGERPVLDRAGPTADWPEYGGDKGGLKWSPLTQVTRENVGALQVAWTYHHGDVSDGTQGMTRSSFNATPIVVDDALFFCTGFNRVIALDPRVHECIGSADALGPRGAGLDAQRVEIRQAPGAGGFDRVDRHPAGLEFQHSRRR